MSDKPSLYVVEKKEVVILVVLFVLVTVLSFTMGVRYGETIGKKTAVDQSTAEREHSEVQHESLGGTLGGKTEDTTSAPAVSGEHPAQEGSHNAESAAHSKEDEEIAEKAPTPEQEKKQEQIKEVDKSADEYLLKALQDAGVEPMGGAAPREEKLPQAVKEVKRALSGTYVIQVGSHPTRTDAESQVRLLRAKKLNAEILSPFKDKHGEWHRVVLGGYKTKAAATKDAKAFKSKGSVSSYFIWRLP